MKSAASRREREQQSATAACFFYTSLGQKCQDSRYTQPQVFSLSLLSLSHTHASTAQRNALSSTYAQIMAILVKSAINFAQADDKKTRFTRCLWFSFRPQRIRRLSIDFIIKLMYRWIGIFHHKQTPRMYICATSKSLSRRRSRARELLCTKTSCLCVVCSQWKFSWALHVNN